MEIPVDDEESEENEEERQASWIYQCENNIEDLLTYFCVYVWGSECTHKYQVCI